MSVFLDFIYKHECATNKLIQVYGGIKNETKKYQKYRYFISHIYKIYILVIGKYLYTISVYKL